MMQMQMRSRAFGKPAAARAAPMNRRAAVVVRAMIREFPDPDYCKEVVAAFPEKGLANTEEARVLIENGYTYVDVRPAYEIDQVGKAKIAVNVPLVNMSAKYDSKLGKKVYHREENPDFIKMMQKKFPKKDAKIMIGCSDGKMYSLDALEMLDEAGYTNQIGLRGGYYAWFKKWDNNLRRRRADGYTEVYNADGDSCGIHGTGAGFDRVDKIESWVPPKF